MSAPRPLSVLLVDDSALVREGMRELLSEDPLVRIVGVAASGTEAMLRFQQLAPDVVLLDIGLPDTSGLTLLRAFKSQRPTCVVIMLTASGECREKAINLGADHFYDKSREFNQASDLVKEIAARRAADARPG